MEEKYFSSILKFHSTKTENLGNKKKERSVIFSAFWRPARQHWSPGARGKLPLYTWILKRGAGRCACRRSPEEDLQVLNHCSPITVLR
jgi:hypothetical protein